MKALGDVWRVARYDLAESLRSWKALALLLLYLAGSMAATGIFVTVLRELENTLADTLAVSTTDKPGALTDELMHSEQLLDTLTGLLRGDAELAQQLVEVPPIALFYFWLALLLVPALVMVTSSDAIARERGIGSARFALFRTPRWAWATGKYLGQALTLAVGVGAGALGVWLIGLGSLASFEPVETALWLGRFALRIWVWGLCWLGVALGISQVTRGWLGAQALALVVLICMGIGGQILMHLPWLQDNVPVLAETAAQLFPTAHKMDLFRPEPSRRLPAIAVLLALGLGAFSLGHARMSRVDV